MIGVDGYCRSLCGTKVQQSMQCATLLIACALFSPISAFGSDFSLSADPPSCSPEQSLRWRGGTLRLENDLFTCVDEAEEIVSALERFYVTSAAGDGAT